MSDNSDPIFEDEELTLHDEAAVASERSRKEDLKPKESEKKDNGADSERFAKPKEKVALKEESSNKNILQSTSDLTSSVPPRSESKKPGNTTSPDSGKDETSLFGNVDHESHREYR